MSQTSRRSFLAATGTGAALTVATATAAGGGPATAAATPSRSDGPLVAHVRDARAGTVVLFRGDEEVVVTDHDLVRRLNRAAGR